MMMPIKIIMIMTIDMTMTSMLRSTAGGAQAISGGHDDLTTTASIPVDVAACRTQALMAAGLLCVGSVYVLFLSSVVVVGVVVVVVVVAVVLFDAGWSTNKAANAHLQPAT